MPELIFCCAVLLAVFALAGLFWLEAMRLLEYADEQSEKDDA